MENDRLSSIIIFRCTFTIYIGEEIYSDCTLLILSLYLANVSFWLNLLSGELQV